MGLAWADAFWHSPRDPLHGGGHVPPGHRRDVRAALGCNLGRPLLPMLHCMEQQHYIWCDLRVNTLSVVSCGQVCGLIWEKLCA